MLRLLHRRTARAAALVLAAGLLAACAADGSGTAETDDTREELYRGVFTMSPHRR